MKLTIEGSVSDIQKVLQTIGSSKGHKIGTVTLCGDAIEKTNHDSR
ncbi:hypothetical protein [Pediococcus ethanolidurans]|uniref:PPC domain-containing protein n=1 Tax=Pediococcus ethanolidurans TaxID=319653 RepID=A0A1H9M4X2_9LACO|nr:hypothetical protein [Pediococcus ethanolidurans]MCV3315608.1 hypothetical protein [Pediococcus ethanolidurans]GEN94723.1 hypothetical protein PET01_07730 [Pediococcus ethanolidurans]SER18692.1 hypothetical protein SAMN04487973_102180 [Pediococcus ethanolidurans]